MPYVNIQLIAGATRDQKKALVECVTQGFTDILRKRPEHLHIVIQEIPAENWGYAGELSDDLLAQNPETYSFPEALGGCVSDAPRMAGHMQAGVAKTESAGHPGGDVGVYPPTPHGQPTMKLSKCRDH